MTTQTIGKCSVWIYGSEMGPAGWIEGKVLEIGEGFRNQYQAKTWARVAMQRLRVSGKSWASRYKIGPAY